MTVARPEPAERLGFLLWRATLRWQRAISAALRPSGLTHVQLLLLATIRWLSDDSSDAPSQRDIAEHAGTDPMMTSQVLRALADRGLVLRLPDRRDARIRRSVLTEAGKRLVDVALAEIDEVERGLFADIDRTTFRTLLGPLGDDRSDPTAG